MYGLNSDFQKKDVAIYARVSTEHEAQLSALENQINWYKPILAARPEWRVVEQYIDEGITGTSATKRPRFMQMIKDAKDKKFDMIITREVSRFARNTVDTLQYTRLLKEYGVEVFFINDNIKTFDGDGELRLTIMATLAQDESRKTSVRVKAGQETSMKQGILYGNGNILGYDRVGKELVINKEQAETVRMIYDMYLSGMGCTRICYELEQAGRLTAMGKEKWWPKSVMQTLKNSFYCGMIVYHKQFTPDFLKQKKVNNRGELEYIKIRGNHTPIVTEDEYDKVNRIINSRVKVCYDNRGEKRTIGAKEHKTAYGRLLICKCGRKFNQHISNRNGRWPGVDYQCYSAYNQGSKAEREKRGLSVKELCDSPFISGWKLDMMAEKIFDRYIDNADTVVDTSYKILEQHINDQQKIPDNSELIDCKRDEYEKLAKKKENLIEMRVEGDIDKEYFRQKKMELDEKMSSLKNQIEKLTPENKQIDSYDYTETLSGLREKLKEYAGFEYSVIPESLVEAFIEKIWVSADEFRWYLRTGKSTDKEFRIEDHLKIGSFIITKEEAKRYLYSFSTKRRVYKWKDLKVSVWI